MKKTLFITLLLTFSTFVYSQNSKEETNAFFEQIQSRKIIENVFNTVKESIKSNENELFESQGLKYGKAEDIEVFHNFLDEEINLFIDDTYNEMRYKYSSKPKDSIIKYISIAKENQNEVLEKTGFKKELESILKEKQVYLINDINLTLREIRAKNNPLILKVIENGKESDVSKIDLDLFLNIKDEKNSKLSILNKDNSEITLPENFDFELIESLTIKYLGNEYLVNRFNGSMPKEIQELTSPLSKYCFEQLEKWTLLIDDNNIILETRGSVGQKRK
ncbi:hypothetical protein [Mesonia aestuariivivens]|uniref:Uncharacterized protein n=1 Tax=Mesonia aestuariivivens TaxID=2796128 RepID=A0ABS6W5R6_9FLAO|nr:hypothetical protein [Mesonia aestuariivivens]MBW2963064.1 hypothetical protein [Mesonia aestuariivivens]